MNEINNLNLFSESCVLGAESLLGKYITFLVDHLKETLVHACSVVNDCCDSFARAAMIVSKDVLGKLLFILC